MVVMVGWDGATKDSPVRPIPLRDGQKASEPSVRPIRPIDCALRPSLFDLLVVFRELLPDRQPATAVCWMS